MSKSRRIRVMFVKALSQNSNMMSIRPQTPLCIQFRGSVSCCYCSYLFLNIPDAEVHLILWATSIDIWQSGQTNTCSVSLATASTESPESEFEEKLLHNSNKH